MSPFKGEALKEVMGKIQRPLAGCDDLSVIKAKNPKEICSYVPLRGVIRENDMWRVIDHDICSYVPLRGVIGKN